MLHEKHEAVLLRIQIIVQNRSIESITDSGQSLERKQKKVDPRK